MQHHGFIMRLFDYITLYMYICIYYVHNVHVMNAILTQIVTSTLINEKAAITVTLYGIRAVNNRVRLFMMSWGKCVYSRNYNT